MKIDKSRFLLLTTSLAATATALAVATVACNSTSTSTDAGDQQPSTTPDGGGNTTNSEGGTDGGGGEQCLGTDGTAPMCSPTGEGGGDDAGADGGATVAKCQFECQSAVSTFKTGVAVAINSCLDKAVADPTVEGACAGALPGCASEAIAQACDDPTAAEFCTTTLAQCGGDDAGADAGAGAITQDKCIAVAKALSGEGKTTLTTCITEGNDCGSCFATASGQP